MIVADIMTRQLVDVHMDDTIEHARRLFEIHGFHHLLVSDGRKLVGVLSDRDLLRHISPFVGKMAERPQDLQTLQRRLHQAMSRDLVTVNDQATVEDAAHIMVCHKVNCLPVLNADGKTVGIVTWRDLVKAWVPNVDECPFPEGAAEPEE